MAYSIDYSTSGAEKVEIPPERRFLWGWTALFSALLLVLLWNFWPEGREVIRNLLIPGDPEVTSQAAAGLIADLQNGSAPRDALTAFCREILQGGAVGY